MNIEKSISHSSDPSIQKNNLESWAGVYRIIALVTLGVVGYGGIKYASDPQVSASVDEIAKKAWVSYITLMTDIENPGTRRVSVK